MKKEIEKTKLKKADKNKNIKDNSKEYDVVIEMTLFTAVMSSFILLIGFFGMLYFMYKIIQL